MKTQRRQRLRSGRTHMCRASQMGTPGTSTREGLADEEELLSLIFMSRFISWSFRALICSR